MINLKRLTQLILSLPLASLIYQPLALAHANHQESASRAVKHQQATIRLTVLKILTTKGKKTVFIKLSNSKTNQPIQLQDLTEVHTQKIHMLVIDDSLSDYSHVHPMEASEPGVYYFSWQPMKQDANYRIWADLVPVNTRHQEYVLADLYKSKSSSAEIRHKLSMETIVAGYQFKLSFEEPQLIKGKASMGKIDINDANGKPVQYLEPVMGAYAHLVGFFDDFKSVVHIHPMGAEPQKSADRGGPELNFHIEPQHAGFIKLFAQVKIKGKELFVPFGLVVRESLSSS